MQTSVIKKTLPLALLLVTGSAWAEWLKVGSSAEDTFYFDSSTIRVEGDKRKVWELVDYKQRDKYGAFSARMRNEYDCKHEKSSNSVRNFAFGVDGGREDSIK